MKCWTCKALAKFFTWAPFCSKKCEYIANRAADQAADERYL